MRLELHCDYLLNEMKTKIKLLAQNLPSIKFISLRITLSEDEAISILIIYKFKDFYSVLAKQRIHQEMQKH